MYWASAARARGPASSPGRTAWRWTARATCTWRTRAISGFRSSRSPTPEPAGSRTLRGEERPRGVCARDAFRCNLSVAGHKREEGKDGEVHLAGLEPATFG